MERHKNRQETAFKSLTADRAGKSKIHGKESKEASAMETLMALFCVFAKFFEQRSLYYDLS